MGMVLASDNEVNLHLCPGRLSAGPSLRSRERDTAAPDCYARPVADQGQEDGGLLGDLPSHRPSVRSPRRKSSAASPKQPVAETRPGGRAAPTEPEQRPSSAAQVARAGAGLAAAPARLGLRIAGRAVDGLGKAVGRR